MSASAGYRSRDIPGTPFGPEHRIGYVDGLRAIAVLTVVATHAGLTTTGQSFGVDLFFVVSGFCLSYPTLAKLRDRGSAAFDVYRYAARRIVRIVPPYWAAIGLLFFVSILLRGSGALGHPSLAEVGRQALFLEKGTTLVTPAFWSLPVEFRWYFVFPIALWLWVASPRALLVVMGLAIIAANGTEASSADLLVLPAFLSGIVAAHIQLHGYRLARFALPVCVVMIVLAYLKSGTLISSLWEAAVFLLAVAGGSLPWFSRILSLKGLTAIGLASYSIYLVHEPIVYFSLTRGINPWVSIVLGVAGGFAFWFVAERPFLDPRLRDRLVAEFEQAFHKWFPRIGIGKALHLSATGRAATAHDLPNVPDVVPPPPHDEDVRA